MAAAGAPVTYEDALRVIERWKVEGLSDEERDTFLTAAMAGTSRTSAQDFQQTISDIADSARKIDAAFNEVDNSFHWITTLQLIIQYPEITGFYAEWKGYQNRWRSCLRQSLGVADESIDILQRFDQVYLSKVENIQTDQDRLDAIRALQQFTDERHDHSATMSQNFHDLKRDIRYFVDKFGKWVAEKGWVVDFMTSILKSMIDAFQREIEAIDAQIRSVKEQLAMAGSSFNYFKFTDGMLSIVVYILQSQRDEKVQSLRALQITLQNIQQTPIAQLKTKLDIWRPDIDIMCDQLLLFAELWSYIRSQAVQFRSHIQAGLEASTNIRFKKEVRLAREVCTPMANGLRKYKSELSRWA